jgi:hypothetical protein
MSKLDFILKELVTANPFSLMRASRSAISTRHPDNPRHYLLSPRPGCPSASSAPML